MNSIKGAGTKGSRRWMTKFPRRKRLLLPWTCPQPLLTTPDPPNPARRICLHSMATSLNTISPAWGPSLKTYVLQRPNQVNAQNSPRGYEIKQAVELLKSGYPSCEHLELLISLAEQTDRLRTFLDDKLVPGCMRLLREYCRTNSVRLITASGCLRIS